MVKEKIKEIIASAGNNIIKVLCDNMQAFWINAEDQFVFWDETETHLVCIRPNVEPNAQYGQSPNYTPWEIVFFDIDMIQFMEIWDTRDNTLKLIDDMKLKSINSIPLGDVKKTIYNSVVNGSKSAVGFGAMDEDTHKEYGYNDNIGFVSLEK